MDTEDGVDVATLDVTRIGIIHGVFWEMNQLDLMLKRVNIRKPLRFSMRTEARAKSRRQAMSTFCILLKQNCGATRRAIPFYRRADGLVEKMLSAEFTDELAILGK